MEVTISFLLDTWFNVLATFPDPVNRHDTFRSLLRTEAFHTTFHIANMVLFRPIFNHIREIIFLKLARAARKPLVYYYLFLSVLATVISKQSGLEHAHNICTQAQER